MAKASYRRFRITGLQRACRIGGRDVTVDIQKRKEKAARPSSYRTTRAFEQKASTPNWSRQSAKSQNQGFQGKDDPLEKQVETFLKAAREPFYRNHETLLDFFLPRLNMFIECKRFYTPRIAEQLSRVPERDVIVIQGIGALEKFFEVAGRKIKFGESQ